MQVTVVKDVLDSFIFSEGSMGKYQLFPNPRTNFHASLGTPPHENGVGPSYLEGSGPGCEAVFGLVPSARERTWSDLGSTPRRTPPCRPRPRGSTKRKLLHASRSSHRTGQPDLRSDRHGPHSFAVRARRPQEDRRRLRPPPRARRPVTSQVRTFGTMTADLLALADWLAARGIRHVAMESTGVYWKPVFNSWRAASPSSWSTPAGSSRSPAARPTSRTPSGSPSCCNTACSPPASSPSRRSASCGT